MLRVVFGRLVVFVATFALGMTASTAMAEHGRGGGRHGGHHGGGHHHHGHGQGHYGSNFYGLGYSGFGYSGLGFSRGGLSISIGSGYPYYRGSSFGGYGFGGYGYGSLNSGYPFYGYSAPIDSPYRRYSPYDLGSAGQPYGYESQRYDEYRYDRVPQSNYVYPDRSRLYSSETPSDPRYSVAKPVAPTSDLRPGMILPDGSTVISVGPLETSNTEAAPIDSTAEGEAVESLEPAAPTEIDAPTAEEEQLQAPVESDDSAEPTEL